MFSPLRRHPLALLLLLALFWSLELFYFQFLTLEKIYSHPSLNTHSFSFLILFNTRLLLNFCLLTAILCAFPSPFIYTLFALNIPFYLTITTYAHHFHRSLSWSTLYAQTKDLFNILPSGLPLVNKNFLLLLLFSLAIKITLYHFFRKQKYPFPLKRKITLAFFLYYAVFFVSIDFFQDSPLSTIKHAKSTKDLGKRYGYFPVWLADAYFLNSKHILQEAIESSKITSDKLSPVESSIILPSKIAIIQVESLDYAVLDLHYNNKPVLPFLNQLKQESMFFKIEAIHLNGSADADFILLTGHMPSSRAVTYRIPHFPYKNTTPQIAAQFGYSFSCIHCWSGNYYNRRQAFNQMAFSQTLFLEEFLDHFDESSLRNTYDEVVFKTSSDLILADPEKSVHFIITLSSHCPFNFIKERDCNFISSPQHACEKYLNSIHYVDSALHSYIEDLPGDTLIFIYGDHESHEKYNYAKNQYPYRDNKEYVPFIIYQKGHNLARLQKTRNTPLATSGELSFLDMASYIRSLFNLSSG